MSNACLPAVVPFVCVERKEEKEEGGGLLNTPSLSLASALSFTLQVPRLRTSLLYPSSVSLVFTPPSDLPNPSPFTFPSLPPTLPHSFLPSLLLLLLQLYPQQAS